MDWLASLSHKARAKCVVRLERLEEMGHELRRPEADYLRDDIYELRAKHAGMNYRMLYFFHGRRAVVVSHGFSKQQPKVPAREINLASQRKQRFEVDSDAHTFKPEE
jgi:phage-related protein